MELVELGFALGIGARVLQEEQLQDVVRRVPLTALLAETDAPYIRPDISHLPGSGKQRKKVRNSSLILPAVIEKIAHLRGEDPAEVEKVIYQNTLLVFRLTDL
jgi:TatD DNase family protein